jgi:hypothetical protein
VTLRAALLARALRAASPCCSIGCRADRAGGSSADDSGRVGRMMLAIGHGPSPAVGGGQDLRRVMSAALGAMERGCSTCWSATAWPAVTSFPELRLLLLEGVRTLSKRGPATVRSRRARQRLAAAGFAPHGPRIRTVRDARNGFFAGRKVNFPCDPPQRRSRSRYLATQARGAGTVHGLRQRRAQRQGRPLRRRRRQRPTRRSQKKKDRSVRIGRDIRPGRNGGMSDHPAVSFCALGGARTPLIAARERAPRPRPILPARGGTSASN